MGETLQFIARYVDINGVIISETPTVAWTSTNPAAVGVSESGLVVGERALSFARIIALADDGVDTADVIVGAEIAGQPATVRFAHTALGVGPITFRPSKGELVTLSFGQSVSVPIQSGILFVETGGFPVGNPLYTGSRFWAGAVGAGGHLSLFGVGGSAQMFLIPAWASSQAAPRDSAFIRFIQGSDFSVVYMRPPGAPMTGIPELCYFDPGDLTEYFRRGTGGFDIIVQAKNPSSVQPVGPELARFGVAPAAGSSVTYVLFGSTPQTAGVLAFPDP